MTFWGFLAVLVVSFTVLYTVTEFLRRWAAHDYGVSGGVPDIRDSIKQTRELGKLLQRLSKDTLHSMGEDGDTMSRLMWGADMGFLERGDHPIIATLIRCLHTYGYEIIIRRVSPNNENIDNPDITTDTIEQYAIRWSDKYVRK